MQLGCVAKHGLKQVHRQGSTRQGHPGPCDVSSVGKPRLPLPLPPNFLCMGTVLNGVWGCTGGFDAPHCPHSLAEWCLQPSHLVELHIITPLQATKAFPFQYNPKSYIILLSNGGKLTEKEVFHTFPIIATTKQFRFLGCGQRFCSTQKDLVSPFVGHN